MQLSPLPTNRAPEAEAGEKKVGTGGSGKVEEEDVKLVVAQTGCTPEKAREALEAEKGDLINASESTFSYGNLKQPKQPLTISYARRRLKRRSTAVAG